MTKLLSSSERKLMEKILYERYGVREPFREYVLLLTGEGKVRAATPEAIEVAEKLKRVQQVGLYVAKFKRGDVSLSIEGSQLLSSKLRENVIELTESQAEEWMRAAPIKLQYVPKTLYVVAKIDKIYLGSGRVSRDGRIYPQVAKWRRIPEE